MIVRAFEVFEGKKVDLIEGDYPDDHMDDLQIGTKIPLVGVPPRQFMVGTTAEPEEVNRGWYLIEDRVDRETEIGVPFVELSLIRIS